MEGGGGEACGIRVMIALRASAILSILVAALYLRGFVLVIHTVGVDSTIWLMLVGVIVPLVPGVLALFGRATILLPVAWGWQLGVHLPKVLTPHPQVSPEILWMMRSNGGNVFASGPDYYGMILVGAALVGLVLYLFWYSGQSERK